MSVTEIKSSELDPAEFIAHEVQEIKNAVGEGLAINALSAGWTPPR